MTVLKLAMPFLMVLCAVISQVHGQSTTPQIPTDWDLLMLKLVNAARVNPLAENSLRGTSYTNPAVAPLSYDPLVGRAAGNHNGWMSANENNLAIYDPSNTGPAPDSFSHYETLNAQSGGTPATATPGYSGASIGNRLNYSGYQWSAAGENIYWRSNTPTIDTSLIEMNHVGWWNSTGHRNNLMSSNFTVMGHHALNGNDHWATQNFGRPLYHPRNYLFGVYYDDLDDSGAWEPYDTGNPNREGLTDVGYNVYSAGTDHLVGAGSTFDNGGFSFQVADGNYDVQFMHGSGDQWVYDLVLNGQNTDMGDIALAVAPVPGDYNDDGTVNGADLAEWRSAFGSTVANPYDGADGDGDQIITGGDFLVWQRNHSGSNVTPTFEVVPEPSSALSGFLCGFVVIAFRRI